MNRSLLFICVATLLLIFPLSLNSDIRSMTIKGEFKVTYVLDDFYTLIGVFPYFLPVIDKSKVPDLKDKLASDLNFVLSGSKIACEGNASDYSLNVIPVEVYFAGGDLGTRFRGVLENTKTGKIRYIDSYGLTRNFYQKTKRPRYLRYGEWLGKAEQGTLINSKSIEEAYRMFLVDIFSAVCGKNSNTRVTIESSDAIYKISDTNVGIYVHGGFPIFPGYYDWELSIALKIFLKDYPFEKWETSETDNYNHSEVNIIIREIGFRTLPVLETDICENIGVQPYMIFDIITPAGDKITGVKISLDEWFFWGKKSLFHEPIESFKPGGSDYKPPITEPPTRQEYDALIRHRRFPYITDNDHQMDSFTIMDRLMEKVVNNIDIIIDVYSKIDWDPEMFPDPILRDENGKAIMKKP